MKIENPVPIVQGQEEGDFYLYLQIGFSDGAAAARFMLMNADNETIDEIIVPALPHFGMFMLNAIEHETGIAVDEKLIKSPEDSGRVIQEALSKWSELSDLQANNLAVILIGGFATLDSYVLQNNIFPMDVTQGGHFGVPEPEGLKLLQ